MPIALRFSEEDLALQFAERHAGRLRYVAAWNQWLEFDGKCWNEDKTRATFSKARVLDPRHCPKSTSPARQSNRFGRTRAAIVSLAGEDRRLAATVDQWDAEPWLLNTPVGVVDLRTGKIRPAKAEDYCTKITAVEPEENCRTPLWSQFLERVTKGDTEYQKYLARVLGYGLTGITREHALFFLYGTGGNGKGVFMTTVAGILGHYHQTAAMETFTESNTDRHPTELAGLRGARMVTATETEQGRRWAESKVKQLTGGDKISARKMRQDFFEFTPQFKLMVSGNHKPGLRSVDEAIRRRLNLLPWTVTIPDAEKDKELPEKLKAEWSGILAWMIQGCLEWQRIGLAPPAAVTSATGDYLQDEDALQNWLDACCEIGPAYSAPVRVLYAGWKQWAEASNEFVGSMKVFSQNIEDRGFQRHKQRIQPGANSSKNKIFLGLRLLEQTTGPEVAPPF